MKIKLEPCTCGEEPTIILSPYKIVGCLRCANGQLGATIAEAKYKWNDSMDKTKQKRCMKCLQTWCEGVC